MLEHHIRITTDRHILAWRLVVCAVLFVLVPENASLAADASLTDLRKQTRDLLKKEADAQDHRVQRSVAMSLCDLYIVLRSDPRYSESSMLRGDAAKLRKRLMRLARQTEAKLNRANVARPSDLKLKVDQAVAMTTGPTDSYQRTQVQLAAGGGGAVDDQGWQLVELIQRIIAPDFWQPQGGPGVVRYFAIKQALVIRATSEVHEQVRELLTALR